MRDQIPVASPSEPDLTGILYSPACAPCRANRAQLIGNEVKDVSPQLSFPLISILEKLFRINCKPYTVVKCCVQIACDILKFTYLVSYSYMCVGRKN